MVLASPLNSSGSREEAKHIQKLTNDVRQTPTDKKKIVLGHSSDLSGLKQILKSK